jgi:hypothetical protein
MSERVLLQYDNENYSVDSAFASELTKSSTRIRVLTILADYQLWICSFVH